MSTGDKNRVDVEGTEYAAMADRWPLLRALMGGVKAMREDDTDWLPRWPGEEKEDYDNRVENSFNSCSGYKDAISQIVSKPFSRTIVLPDDSPQFVADLASDCDRAGRSLTMFARDVFRDGVDRGVSHILIDAPDNGGDLYMSHIKAANLIGWKLGQDGALEQVRIRETAVVASGAWGDTSVNRVRVIDRGNWELWQQDEDDGDWYRVAGDEGSGTHDFGMIPIVSFYTQRTGYLTAEPPLEDLAWVNLDYWQSYSNHRYALDFARFAMLEMVGFSREELDTFKVVSPRTILKTTNEKARTGYAEHGGKALGVSQDQLDRLERKMAAMGMRPMVERSGDITATETAINEARSDSDLQAWIVNLEATLESALRLIGRFQNTPLPEEFHVEISHEFSLKIADPNQIKALIEVRKNGQIDHHTFLDELRRRNVLGENVDINAVIEALDKESMDEIERLTRAADGRNPDE